MCEAFQSNWKTIEVIKTDCYHANPSLTKKISEPPDRNLHEAFLNFDPQILYQIK